MRQIELNVQSTKNIHRKRSEYTLEEVLHKYQHKLRKNTQKGNSSFLVHLKNFAGKDVILKQVTPRFCYKFAEYLMDHVQVNSARTYLQKLHAVLQEAVRLHYISHNPMPPISDLLPHYIAPERAYLSVKEIKKLQKAECPHESTKLAFILSCFTGLRLSDIETLKWSHFHHNEQGWFIIKNQVKTNKEVRIPLGVESLKILKIMKEFHYPNGFVFRLHSRTTICSDLIIWAEAAGIKKHVTFHVSRHSFATLAIAAGVNIYTVSKLCGHTSITTTQIYAKMLDSTRVEAIACVDNLFSDHPKSRSKVVKNYDIAF